MNTCVNCGKKLTRKESAFGVYWSCDACGGCAVSMSILRKALKPGCVLEAWAAAREHPATGRNCPMCDHAMSEVPLEIEGVPLMLDVCKICQFFWFDPHELEALPQAPPPPAKADDRLPQEAREAIAIQEALWMGERARAADPSPDAVWKTVPAILGLPVEAETMPLRRIPWGTFTLSLAIALVSLCALPHLRSIVRDYGLVPAEVWDEGGFTLISSFFLHAGILHLVGNLYFLVVFGSRVEDFLGPLRFLALVLVATVFGGVLHVLAQPHSTVPCVGASGGISGLLAFYALKYPRAELDFIVQAHWVKIPAWAAFVFWILLQLVFSLWQLSGLSNVAALAHIGGAMVGAAYWLSYRKALDPVPSA